MKRKNHFFVLLVVLLFIGSCAIQKDSSEQMKEIDELATEAKEKSEEVAELLAGTIDQISESEEEQDAIDKAIQEADKKAEEVADLLAEMQPTDPAVYILGIQENETPRCTPSELYREFLTKAIPDEKFFGIGDCRNEFNPKYPYKDSNWPGSPDLCEDWIPKTNEAYVWGLTKCGNRLFFGTGPNIHCLVLQGYLGYTKPILDEAYVCEGEAAFGCPDPAECVNCPNPDTCTDCPNKAYPGDWRPPSMYEYHIPSNSYSANCWVSEGLRNLTEFVPEHWLINTVGIRSAGCCDGVVFLAGPAFVNPLNTEIKGGINIFAFDGREGQFPEFLGAWYFDQYNNIRKWIVVNNELYVGVGGEHGGAVLKWLGNCTSKCQDGGVDLANLFNFVEVGSGMDGIVSELCEHEGRIFVTTWPQLNQEIPQMSLPAGLWMSPKLCPTLDHDDTNKWEKVWSVLDYEPDLVTALSYGGGALASSDGCLYWGTMHVPLTSTLAHFRVYEDFYADPPDELEIALALLGTWRAIAIFRGKNLDGRRWVQDIDLRWGKRLDPRKNKMYHSRWKKEFQPKWGKRFDPLCGKKIELLYGEWLLPVYVPGKGWRLKPNKMSVSGLGVKPKYGHSGFGNLFNNYCWTMEVYNKKVYVGTMDWSYLLFGTLDLEFAGYDFSILEKLGIQGPKFGADLYCFPDCYSPAKLVDASGAGNRMNYGIRTMVADDALYLGSANPMNLSHYGGWELIRYIEY